MTKGRGRPPCFRVRRKLPVKLALRNFLHDFVACRRAVLRRPGDDISDDVRVLRDSDEGCGVITRHADVAQSRGRYFGGEVAALARQFTSVTLRDDQLTGTGRLAVRPSMWAIACGSIAFTGRAGRVAIRLAEASSRGARGGRPSALLPR